MNNKLLGIEFENKIVTKLARLGYWVHFLNPDPRGAQPFDILAIKGGEVLAIDCKTCKQKSFSIERLEDNQQLSFDAIQKKTTAVALVIIEHNEHIFVIPYNVIKREERIKLDSSSLCLYHDLEVKLNEE